MQRRLQAAAAAALAPKRAVTSPHVYRCVCPSAVAYIRTKMTVEAVHSMRTGSLSQVAAVTAQRLAVNGQSQRTTEQRIVGCNATRCHPIAVFVHSLGLVR